MRIKEVFGMPLRVISATIMKTQRLTIPVRNVENLIAV
jgi:hypothetical protein